MKEENGLDFALVAMDITDDFELFERYKYDIPIVHYGEEYWFKHRSPGTDVLLSALGEGGGWDGPIGEQPDAGKMEK